MLKEKSPDVRNDTLWFGNTIVDVLVSSADGADGISVVEHRMP